MLKLYGGQRSRAAIVMWYLEELGLPYESIPIDLEAEEQRKPEFLAINPFGKVPVLRDGDFTLSESGAILLYLADKHGRLPDNPEGRAEAAQWVLFTLSTLVVEVTSQDVPEERVRRLFETLDRLLSQREYLIGGGFGVADVCLGAVLAFGRTVMNLDLSPYPAVTAYADRLTARPAFQKSMSLG